MIAKLLYVLTIRNAISVGTLVIIFNLVRSISEKTILIGNKSLKEDTGGGAFHLEQLGVPGVSNKTEGK